MAIAALPVGLKKEAEIDHELVRQMLHQPAKPCLRYREDSGVPPGYFLSDIRAMLHPDDFIWFEKDVKPCGELDGESIIWALDYVRWIIREEER